MNSKQVRAVLCGLYTEEQKILKDEYGISARVSDVGPGVTEEMKTHAIGWLYGTPSVYTLTNRPDEFRSSPSGAYNAASHKHTKPERQRSKEIAKRRKNNRNKKTHRKK
jgi:hypothetical protein